jgi:hypothetical protein
VGNVKSLPRLHFNSVVFTGHVASCHVHPFNMLYSLTQTNHMIGLILADGTVKVVASIREVTTIAEDLRGA